MTVEINLHGLLTWVVALITFSIIGAGYDFFCGTAPQSDYWYLRVGHYVVGALIGAMLFWLATTWVIVK